MGDPFNCGVGERDDGVSGHRFERVSGGYDAIAVVDSQLEWIAFQIKFAGQLVG